MKFRVRTLRRAEADIRSIARYIHERSSAGAAAWLTAVDQVCSHLSEFADGCGEAEENAHFELDVRQALFKTRRGRIYRLVFTIDDDEVRVLRVRGPGQAAIDPDEA